MNAQMKMTVQQYCLRWNNHQPNFISVFSSLLSSQSLVDVTLAAEGKQLQAHKVVLSACSSYFQALFATNPCKHPIVILKDVKFSDLRVMVDFMYHGEVSVSQEQLPCILNTAEMLKIKGLTEIPVENSAARCQNYTTDTTEVPVQEDEQWSVEETNRSTSPLSPSSKRKRLKKNVICTTTTVTEQTEVGSNEILLSTVDNVFATVLKTEPDRHGTDNSGHRYSTPTPIQTIHPGTSHLRESEPTQHQIITQVTPPEVTTAQNLECSSVELPRTCTTQHTTTTGIQWNVLDQSSFSHYSSPPAVLPNPVAAPPFAHPASPNPAPLYAPSEPYAGIKRKRNFNPQGDENFLRALEAVRFGGIGFCKAARMYGVNNRTLWLEYKKRGYPNFRSSIKNRNQAQNAQAQQEAQQQHPQQMEEQQTHPIAIISSAVFDSKQVVDRSKYYDGTEHQAETISFQSINLEQM